MTETPELDAFRASLERLRKHRVLAPVIKRGKVNLRRLSKEDVAALLREKDKVAYYFLIGAADLNRSSLKAAVAAPEMKVAPKDLRQAYAVCRKLPVEESFDVIVSRALRARSADLGRMGRSEVEQFFRERLKAEGIPLLMSPPIRSVPGLLIERRKPDGVYPDPAAGLPPLVYLEVKNIKRVSDDIQKRLYELAEASLEMKILYGELKVTGLNHPSTKDVVSNPALRKRVQRMIRGSKPVVVGLFLCPLAEAEKYRVGAETFVDRVFFQEEIEECLTFLRNAVLG